MKRITPVAICVSLALAVTTVVFSTDAMAREDRWNRGRSQVASRQSERAVTYSFPACEARLLSLNTKTETLRTRASHQLSTIDKVYNRTVEYVVAHNLTEQINNYSKLTDRAVTAKEAADSRVGAFRISSENFSCTKAETRNDLTALASTAIEQRDALQNYRNTVKQLLTAVKKAAGVE